MKSLQLRLNEFFDRMDKSMSEYATAAAYSKARKKLAHTAFIELNQTMLSNIFYDKKENTS